MGLPAQTEKDMMEVSSPLKPRESPIAIEVGIKGKYEPSGCYKNKGIGPMKKIS